MRGGACAKKLGVVCSSVKIYGTVTIKVNQIAMTKMLTNFRIPAPAGFANARALSVPGTLLINVLKFDAREVDPNILYYSNLGLSQA